MISNLYPWPGLSCEETSAGGQGQSFMTLAGYVKKTYVHFTGVG